MYLFLLILTSIALLSALPLGILFRDRAPKAFETCPDELKTKLGGPDDYRGSKVLMPLILLVVALPSLGFNFLGELPRLYLLTPIMVYWAWNLGSKVKVYLAARTQYAEILSADARRVLSMGVLECGLLLLPVLGFSIFGIHRILEIWTGS